METFVEPDSIVRRIWGRSDTILFIFAGSAAEFALNKAVDWLYFTGKLPADPLGRLFSTVRYARRIVFSGKAEAEAAIDQINNIHKAIENARGEGIPDWAYRDVLFMLIHYSIAAYELLERPLNAKEKEAAYEVFLRIGQRMGLKELPPDYVTWLPVRRSHMMADLAFTNYTADLFAQYKKHLGSFRFRLLKEAQVMLLPPEVRHMLGFKNYSLIRFTVPIYKASRFFKLDGLVKKALLPAQYLDQVNELDIV